MSKIPVLQAIGQQKVIGIVRARTTEQAHASGAALLQAGLRVVEISLVSPGALEVIADLARAAPPDAFVGVGTAMSAQDVHAAAAAGASFVVSPTMDPDVVRASTELELASIPGAATPTEAITALRAGADLVKIFPASAWSPAVMRDVLASLPQVPFAPTGGISLDACREWIDAGAVAVGLGSALTQADPDTVAARIEALLAALG